MYILICYGLGYLNSISPLTAASTVQNAPVSVDESTPNPTAGEPYTLDCVVGTPNLRNSDITWVGPDGMPITATSGRVSVGDVFQRDGNSVRTLTFNPLSTEDSGAYRCQTTTNTATSTLTSQGMSLLVYRVCRQAYLEYVYQVLFSLYVHVHLSTVPEPDTQVTTTPPNPMVGQPATIDCSSSVPPNLQGRITVTLIGPDGTVLANQTADDASTANFNFPRIMATQAGVYRCEVTVTSRLLQTPDGNPRPLQDTETLPVTLPRKHNTTILFNHLIQLLWS